MTSRAIAGAAVTAAILFTFMEAGMAVEPRDIQGSWRLVSVDGQAVEAGEGQPHFSIEGEAISGYDGCNRFGGTVGGPITVGQRACAAGHVALPLDLSDLAAHLAATRLQGDELLLPARAGFPASVFRRAE